MHTFTSECSCVQHFLYWPAGSANCFLTEGGRRAHWRVNGNADLLLAYWARLLTDWLTIKLKKKRKWRQTTKATAWEVPKLTIATNYKISVWFPLLMFGACLRVTFTDEVDSSHQIVEFNFVFCTNFWFRCVWECTINFRAASQFNREHSKKRRIQPTSAHLSSIEPQSPIDGNHHS